MTRTGEHVTFLLHQIKQVRFDIDDMFVIRNPDSSFLAIRMPNKFYSIGTVSSMGISHVQISQEQLAKFIKWTQQEGINE